MEWDEAKRQMNLSKHGLDFANADQVLDNPYRLDIDVIRKSELRTQSFAYAFGYLAVLTVVHKDRARLISFRRASRLEREVYYEWLQNDYE